MSQLRGKKHRNTNLQADFDKHGSASFKWDFLECTVDQLMEMEQYFINNHDKNKLYNMDLSVRKTPRGIKRSERTKALVSSSKKGVPNPLNAGDRNGSKKPEICKAAADRRKLLSDEECIKVYWMYLKEMSQMEITNRLRLGSRTQVRTAIKYTERYLMNSKEY